MITPQYLLPIHSALVVDLFAGGGGASTGIEQAIGRHVDVAINHDPEAVSLHEANHPQTRHFVSDVFEVDPHAVCGDQPVGLLWASPDCKHFSKAKGGKPVSKKIRSLAWVVVKWAAAVKPRVICLENVEEFQTWGPLGPDNRPCPQRKGQTFQRWKRQLERMGYVVEHRELRACDYGAPTIRRRLFLVARCDGQPIVWPEATHGAPDSLPVRQKKLKPWRTAAECIDWSVPAPSIFERERPLADATCRRIAKGIMRYVVDAAEPFIVVGEIHDLQHQQRPDIEPAGKGQAHRSKASRGTQADDGMADRVRSVLRRDSSGHCIEPGSVGSERLTDSAVATGHTDKPAQTEATGRAATTGPTTCSANGTDLLIPTLIQTGYGERPGQAPRVPGLDKPLGTVVAGQKHALVSAFLAKHYTGVVGSDLNDPMATVTSVDHHSLVAAHLVHMGHGEQCSKGKKRWSDGTRDVAAPLNTVTASSVPAGVITSHLCKLRGDNVGSGTDEPLHTISAQGTHHAEVRAFLIKYYGTDQDPQLGEPLHTVTTKDRFGIVTVKGEPYAIVDIGLRMLTPRELYRAQGFPDAYRIDTGAAGEPITKTAQVRMCGNSVCPPLARAIVAANYTEHQALREAA